MFNRLALAATAIFVAVVPLAASAGEVDQRIHHEQRRIDAGVASGQLTRNEYSHVQTRLDRINAARVHDLRADGGRLTPAQYRNLNAREDSLSKSIYFDNHDRAVQPGTSRPR